MPGGPPPPTRAVHPRRRAPSGPAGRGTRAAPRTGARPRPGWRAGCGRAPAPPAPRAAPAPAQRSAWRQASLAGPGFRHARPATFLTDRPPRRAIYCMPVPEEPLVVRRSLLRDDVFRRLRDAIVDGSFAPGEQLRDLELATWLGVSRTPVREALLRLAEAGLVVARPGRSTMVSTLDMRAVRDARDVVAAMHELAVRNAVGNLTEADLETMREANRRFRAA